MAKGKKTGGRAKGTKNKTEPEVRALARQYTEAAIKRLAQLMGSADGDTAPAACTAILDRGWGKPAQAVLAAVNPGGGTVGFHDMWVALTTGKFDGASPPDA
jgi:hypothetical protein